MSTVALSRSELRLIERKKELRRRLLLAFFIMILFVFMSIMFFSSKSLASDGSTQEYYKYFKTVKLEAGDSLESLAEEYANPEMTTEKLYIEEVVFINNLESADTPISDRYIIIPYYTTIHS